jgi:REP element-mobilizing transposase RayT
LCRHREDLSTRLLAAGVRSYGRLVPRIARGVALSGGRYFHVTSRGVEGRPVVLDDDDPRAFVGLLKLVAIRFRWRVHAYCLMDNHVHLVVETRPELLSRGMHRLLFRHAQRFNLRYGRKGHLFGDRFSARVIRHLRYLVNACAYVRWNSVRAGLAATPADWRWGGRLLPRRRRLRAGRDPPLHAATLARCAS